MLKQIDDLLLSYMPASIANASYRLCLLHQCYDTNPSSSLISVRTPSLRKKFIT